MANVPNPIDVHVGKRVRARRTLMGLSQSKLGKAINTTFQQVQKYERGMNRISSSRLYQIAEVLDVPIPYFFDDLPANISGRKTPGLADVERAPFEGDPMASQETLKLVRAYYRIQSPLLRQRLRELVKALSTQT
ncbi:MAG: helix-turn-helix transcriptional regulator [Alphaproteobacteria bacterium]|jgi:transcriptional regulator with XRE-family HTH domain|nr:helix-turn-helix transcriptional regulator [Rhodospirillales bacterium]MDP6588502.1 helix-turn-helix transcriptional regulator [Alphaproteobacteria bacterium]MDP6819097.1 helix-turn-helix transcriptional regulator [Alphaproteobacteria bacterium]|tara:strand:+ start:260 stop:664 length:405 start_codon:yes stop_codon:yes gene_type:complete